MFLAEYSTHIITEINTICLAAEVGTSQPILSSLAPLSAAPGPAPSARAGRADFAPVWVDTTSFAHAVLSARCGPL